MCEFCGGVLCLLGLLGHMAHFRCQNCGMEFSQEVDDEEAAEMRSALDGS